MRRALLVLSLLVLLAGCAAPVADVGDGPPTDRPAATSEDRPDPDGDTLGWHDGYWFDDPVSVNTTNGLNETEREIVMARSIARVEYIRGLEFEEDVNLTVLQREEFGEEFFGDDGNGETTPEDLYEDAIFEATFLVGPEDSAGDVQEETRRETVGGFYSPGSGDVVVISDSETPVIDRGTLVHELTHALQDQHFDLQAGLAAETHDQSHGYLGLIEGDAELVRFEYEDYCEVDWECIEYPEDPDPADDPEDVDIHMGLFIMEFFPYSDGPSFVDDLRDGGDWAAVNEAYETLPNSSAEIILSERYGTVEPDTVALSDRHSGGWSRVERQGDTDHERLGRASLSTMFAYTLYDDSQPRALVTPDEFLNLDGGSIDERNPLNYDIEATTGWTGDRLHVYHDGDDLAYVWRITWESSDDAERFVEEYHDLLGYWGGFEVEDGRWEIGDDSDFTGAYRVEQDGSTVTITDAPTRAELDAVRDPEG